MNNPIDIDEVPQGAIVLASQQPVAPVGLFGSEPGQVIERATAVATALKDVIRKQGLISKISGKEYPRCEAWTLLGTMIGVFPVLCWTKEIEGGYEARVEAKTLAGAVVGAAEAICTHSERNWKDRDEFALKSMAQTRATAKALRMPLGFVMTLAGYEATPAEEMMAEAIKTPPTPQSTPRQPLKARAAAQQAEFDRAERCKARWLHIMRDEKLEIWAWDWARTNGHILPTARLDSISALHVPDSKEQFDIVKSDITLRKQKCIDGGGVPQELDEAYTAAHLPDQISGAESPKQPAKAPDAQPAKAASAADPRSDSPVPAPTNKCPHCHHATIRVNPDLVDTWNCDSCGWQWGADRKYFEEYDWQRVICPVPAKGQKKAEYDKSPLTLGQCFRQDSKRGFGLVMNFTAKPWTAKDGTERPPSAADVKFAEACQAAKAHLSAGKAQEL